MTTIKKAAVAILGICSAIGLMSFSPTNTNSSAPVKTITQPLQKMPLGEGALMLRPMMPVVLVLQAEGQEAVVMILESYHLRGGGPLPEEGSNMQKAAAAKMQKL